MNGSKEDQALEGPGILYFVSFYLALLSSNKDFQVLYFVLYTDSFP